MDMTQKASGNADEYCIFLLTIFMQATKQS